MSSSSLDKSQDFTGLLFAKKQCQHFPFGVFPAFLVMKKKLMPNYISTLKVRRDKSGFQLLPSRIFKTRFILRKVRQINVSRQP
jgi:hypothetical protein